MFPLLAAGLGVGALGALGNSGALGSWWNQRPGVPQAPQMGNNPYLQNWGTLIGQLQQNALGQGQSLAANDYKQAADQGINQELSMARNGSAGSARNAQYNAGRITQGLAQGYANASTQEQMASYGALMNALQGAGNAWFRPQSANLQSQLQTNLAGMQQPTNGQALTGYLGGLLPGLGMLAGGKQQSPGGSVGSNGLITPTGW